MQNSVSAPPRTERRASQKADRRFMPHLDGFMQAQFGERRQERAHDRACTHWPMDGVAKIQAASRALLVMAELWEHGETLAKSRQVRPAGCIDVASFGAGPQADVMMLRAAALPDEIEALKLAMRGQAEEFERISAWLVRAARTTRVAAKAAQRPLGLVAVLSEDHRVIAKDLVAADMNALVATLLGEALRVLDCVEPNASAINADLLGARAYEAFLHTAAEMLNRAGALATESALFVEDVDRQWRAFRVQIATVVALSKEAVGACTRAPPA